MYSIDKLNRRELIGAMAAASAGMLLPGRVAQALSRDARSRLILPYNIDKGKKYDGFVGTRSGGLYGFGGNAKIMGRTAHFATTDIWDIRIAFANTYFNENDGSENVPGTTTNITAAVEWSGNFKEYTFNRQPNWTLPATAGSYVEADRLFLPVKIPKGSVFFTRQYLQSSGGTCVGYAKNRDSANGDLCNLNASTDQTMGGTITNSGTNFSPPYAVLGTTDQPSVGNIGDSIGYGPLDESGNAPTDFRRGVVCHGFPSQTLAFSNMCNSTVQAATFIAAAPCRLKLFPYFSHFVDALGRNDITLAGHTPATLMTDLAKIRAYAHPRAKWIRTTLTPDTSSTDAFATDVNQSYRGQEANRLSFNTSVRAILAGYVDYFEVDYGLESVAQVGKWLASQTGDGIHPNAAGYITSGPAISSHMDKIYWS